MHALTHPRLFGRDVYYGWLLVAALGISQTTTWGIVYYAFGALIKPMQDEFGWSLSAIAGAYSLALILSGISAVPVGRWLDHRGARGLMSVGTVGAAALLIVWSQVHDLVAFYLVWIGIGIAMSAILYEPVFALVAVWFARKRSRAFTLLTSIAAFASTIFLPLTAWLVEIQGWRAALLTLAVILIVIAVPIPALLVRHRPVDFGLQIDGGTASTPLVSSVATRDAARSMSAGEAIRRPSFWWLSIAFAIGTLTLVAVGVHLIAYLSGVGHSPTFAASAVGLIGAMKMPSRIVFGPLGDRVSLRYLTAIIFALQAVGLIVLVLVPGITGVMIFAVIFGVAVGAMTNARPALLAEIYGSGSFASISGAMTATSVASRGIAPLGVGLLYDTLGTYDPIWWGLAVLSVLAIAAVLLSGTSARAPSTVRSVG